MSEHTAADEHVVTREQIDKFMDTVDKDTMSDLCVQITKELQDACDNVGKKYLEIEKKFPELMAAMGFTVIATCNALPIDIEHAPICVVLGTEEGIQHAAQPIIEVFKKIGGKSNNDREVQG